MADADLRSRLTDSVNPRTARSYVRDLGYFWAWVAVAYGVEERTYPVPLEWLIEFVEEHIAGLSLERQAHLQAVGQVPQGIPLSVSTIRRYLAPLSVEHTLMQVANTCRHPTFTFLMRRLGRKQNKRTREHLPITRDILHRLLAACGHDLRGHRNRALLVVGFAGGGRRASELTHLSIEHLERVEQGYLARIPVHKTSGRVGTLMFPIFDRAAEQLDRWLSVSRINRGRVFRGINNHGNLLDQLSLQSVCRVVKSLCINAGLPPSKYTAHSLRSGFISQTARDGIPLTEAMVISGHRSLTSALTYYRGGLVINNRAARMSESIDPLITTGQLPVNQVDWIDNVPVVT